VNFPHIAKKKQKQPSYKVFFFWPEFPIIIIIIVAVYVPSLSPD